jgi:Fic family protein
MDELVTSIAAKKERLDRMRPVSRAALLSLQKAYDVDLTYTSNAIEGNTLTLRETAELIEHDITVGQTAAGSSRSRGPLQRRIVDAGIGGQG